MLYDMTPGVLTIQLTDGPDPRERDSQPVFRLVWNVGKLASRRYFYSRQEAEDHLEGIVLTERWRMPRWRLTNVRTAEVLASSEAGSGTDPVRGS